MHCTGLQSTRGMLWRRYSTLKRLTPMIVLLLKVAFTRNFPSRSLAASVACVVAGCIVAGIGDLTFDVSGYMCALTSCLLQALYLLMVRGPCTNRPHMRHANVAQSAVALKSNREAKSKIGSHAKFG